jgi:hypothetical protein
MREQAGVSAHVWLDGEEPAGLVRAHALPGLRRSRHARGLRRARRALGMAES